MTIVNTPVPDPSDQAEAEARALRAQLWMRAHHEAAHAVVGTLFGKRVTAVEVWGGPPVGGRTELSALDDDESAAAPGPAPGPDAHATLRQIVYLMAGPVAARISAGGSAQIMNDTAAFVSIRLGAVIDDPDSAELPLELVDIKTVAGLVVGHFGADDEAGIAAAVDHLGLSVESLVRDHWSSIQTVAGSLLRSGRLTEIEFHSLWSRALSAASTQHAPMLPDSLSEI
jgi:hypothetical protein